MYPTANFTLSSYAVGSSEWHKVHFVSPTGAVHQDERRPLYGVGHGPAAAAVPAIIHRMASTAGQPPAASSPALPRSQYFTVTSFRGHTASQALEVPSE